jgi:hypothetical protein
MHVGEVVGGDDRVRVDLEDLLVAGLGLGRLVLCL